MRLRLNNRTLILTMIGALLIGCGLSYFVAMTEDTRYEMTEWIKERWRADYDILVRPTVEQLGAIDRLERDQDMLEANYLSSVAGGITVAQLESIRGIPGVEVAAPVAMCGSASFWQGIPLDYVPQEPGLYRIEAQRTYLGGAAPLVLREARYYAVGEQFYEIPGLVGRMSPGNPMKWGESIFITLAAIDPSAESQLVGLDKAIDGQCLPQEYRPSTCRGSHSRVYLTIPVLVRSTPTTMFEHRLEVSRLWFTELPDLEYDDRAAESWRAWFDELPGELLAETVITERDAHRSLPAWVTGGGQLCLCQRPARAAEFLLVGI